MEIRSCTCQVRWDIKSDGLPIPVLSSDGVKMGIASIVKGRVADTEAMVREVREQALRFGEGNPEKFAQALDAIETQRKAVIEIRDGLFRAGDDSGNVEPPVVVEDLTVRPQVLYVRAQAKTCVCVRILQGVAQVLQAAGVASDLLASHDEDFATGCVAVLQGRIEGFFSPSFVRFVAQDLTQAAGRQDKKRVVVHPFNIQMKIHEWDHRPPFVHLGWDFDIQHVAFDDHDACVYKTFSRFDYETHCRLLTAIDRCLQPSPNPPANER